MTEEQCHLGHVLCGSGPLFSYLILFYPVMCLYSQSESIDDLSCSQHAGHLVRVAANVQANLGATTLPLAFLLAGPRRISFLALSSMGFLVLAFLS